MQETEYSLVHAVFQLLILQGFETIKKEKKSLWAAKSPISRAFRGIHLMRILLMRQSLKTPILYFANAASVSNNVYCIQCFYFAYTLYKESTAFV